MTDLSEIVEKKKLTEELGPYLDRIEADFVAVKDRLLTSATAGLSLSVVIHEVEKGIAELVGSEAVPYHGHFLEAQRSSE